MTPLTSKHGRRLTITQRSHCQDFAAAKTAATEKLSVAKFARLLGCSRSAIYRWMHREHVLAYKPGPAPGQLRRPLPEGARQDAETWRFEKGYNLEMVTGALQDEYPEADITKHQVQTLAKQEQWAPLTPRRERTTKPFTDQPVGFLHADLIIGPEMGRGPVVLTIRERHSRWVDALAVSSKSSADVTMGFHTLLRRCPVRITTVLTDCGSEFYADFDAYCMTQGITHRRTKPRHPQTNGLVERLNGLLKQYGPLSDPTWWTHHPAEMQTQGELWAEAREPDRVFPDKRLPRMIHTLARWCAWRNIIRPNWQLKKQSPLAWCLANPNHCLPHILRPIVQTWVAHPELMMVNGHRWAHAPPATWCSKSVPLSPSS